MQSSPVGVETAGSNPVVQSPGQSESPSEYAGNLLAEETAETETKLLAGKYKSADELEKGYNNLLKHLQNKNPDFVDPNNPADPAEVEVFEYQGVPELAEELGLEYGDGSEGMNEFLDIAKEGKLRQDIVNRLARHHAKQMDKAIDYQLHTHGIDQRTMLERKAELQKVWGKDFERNSNAVTKWSKANLDPGIWGPLVTTPMGMQLLNTFRLNRGDHAMITDADSSGHDVLTDLAVKLQEVIKSDAYRNSEHPLHKQAHDQREALIQKKLRAQGAV